ncbi:MAG: nucleoside triphosphate pyrophosphohydrolase [Kiritimatiellae bacterium]|nr:nucleoside triphosphate pyrophosphohydrolase [Kiritimatiellia bacterium]
MTDDPDAANKRGIDRLLDVVGRLRSEGGCPWDREQTLHTLKQYLIEESYELIDAIDTGSVDEHREELGDVLLQIALQSRIREEQDDFAFDDVAHTIADKLIHRHPHVFGDVTVSDSKQVLKNWEVIKAGEREKKGTGNRSILDGLPKHLPALQKAQRIQVRASRVGFDWEKSEDVLAKIDEELAETREAIASSDEDMIREELGDLLFSVVNLCRFHGVDSEDALRGTVRKFILRFKEIEGMLRTQDRKMQDCTLDELENMWKSVKGVEKERNDE